MLDSFDQKGQSTLSNFSLPNAARKLENYEPRPINWIKSILDYVSLPNQSEQVKTKYYELRSIALIKRNY